MSCRLIFKWAFESLCRLTYQNDCDLRIFSIFNFQISEIFVEWVKHFGAKRLRDAYDCWLRFNFDRKGRAVFVPQMHVMRVSRSHLNVVGVILREEFLPLPPGDGVAIRNRQQIEVLAVIGDCLAARSAHFLKYSSDGVGTILRPLGAIEVLNYVTKRRKIIALIDAPDTSNSLNEHWRDLLSAFGVEIEHCAVDDFPVFTTCKVLLARVSQHNHVEVQVGPAVLPQS